MDDPDQKIIPLEILSAKKALLNLIDFIDVAINKEYNAPKKMTLRKSVKPQQLAEKKMFGILTLVNRHNPTITPIFIKTLIYKNNLFKKTIDYFCKLATQNLETVTSATLDIVTDHLCEQPIKQLNKLELPIKEYVMSVAYKNLQYLYNVVFKGHENTIECVDISRQAHLAASASTDGTFRLWNLENGQELHIFNEIANSGYVRFSPDGNLLATATAYQYNPIKTRITIWNTASKQQLHTIKHKDHLMWIQFIPYDNETIIHIAKQYSLLPYVLRKNNNLCSLKQITQGIENTKIDIDFAKANNDYSWYITVNSRILALCARALHNTQNEEALANLIFTTTYRTLSHHEQDIFNAKLSQKLLALMPHA